MSFVLETKTAFRSDVGVCPVCGEEPEEQQVSFNPYVVQLVCANGHPYCYLETHRGPRTLDTVGEQDTSGVGEVGWFEVRENVG